MAAIIKRAFDLKKIGGSYYRKLFTQLNVIGYRLDEPNAFAPEEPTVIQDIIDVHMKDLRYSVRDLSKLVRLHEHEFCARYFPEQPRLRLVD